MINKKSLYIFIKKYCIIYICVFHIYKLDKSFYLQYKKNIL